MNRKEDAYRKMSDAEVLEYAREHGMIDLSGLREDVTMSKRKDILKNYHCWQSKDGKWKVHLPDKTKPSGRRIVERKTQREIEDVIIAYHKEQEENPTLQELFNEWNNDRARTDGRAKAWISQSTRERYQQDFLRYYGDDFGSKKIKDVSAKELKKFLTEQVPRFDLTEKAFSGLKMITLGMLQLAEDKDLIDFSAKVFVDSVKVPKKAFRHRVIEDEEEVFNENEFLLIMRHLKDHLDKPANVCLLLMFVTGIRVGEAVALKHADIRDDVVMIRRTEIRVPLGNGKYEYLVRDFPKTEAGIRPVRVPSNFAWLLRRMKEMNPFGEWIFVAPRTKERMTTASVRRRLYTVCDNTGIARRSPHKIRKTYATILEDNNCDECFILTQMGHTDIRTTETFYHRDRKSADRKQQIIDAIPEFKAV